jgi:hypothetical protein
MATADEVRISLDTENDTQSAPLFRQWEGTGGLRGAPSLALPETVVKALLAGSIVREGCALRVNWTGWPQTVRVQGVKGDSQGRGPGMRIGQWLSVVSVGGPHGVQEFDTWHVSAANVSIFPARRCFHAGQKGNRYLARFSC